MKKKETEFEKLLKKIDKLTELVQDEFHSNYERMSSVERRVTLIEGRLTDMEDRLNRKIDEGIVRIERRIDTIVQPQLDSHASRIKKLEHKVLSYKNHI